MKKSIKICSFLVMFLFVGVVITQTVNAQETREKMRVDANFEHGSEYKEADAMNIGDTNNVTTNPDIWERDMPKKPEGVYCGPLLPNSEYSLDYEPRWRNEYDHGSSESNGEYGW
ncbi:MAG: hypothetical protein ACLFUH_07110, partial [Bacteroidales bacterium]